MYSTVRLTRDEFLEEVDFLLSQGVSPIMICEQLGMAYEAAEQRLRRYDRADIASLFDIKPHYGDLRLKTRFTN